MHKYESQVSAGLYDPDLPTANDVMASLCCVAAQYAKEPSLELAALAFGLANTLTAPEYAESKLIESVAKNLVDQWNFLVQEHEQLAVQDYEASGLQLSTTLQ